jgi:hypothetical protein
MRSGVKRLTVRINDPRFGAEKPGYKTIKAAKRSKRWGRPRRKAGRFRTFG